MTPYEANELKRQIRLRQEFGEPTEDLENKLEALEREPFPWWEVPTWLAIFVAIVLSGILLTNCAKENRALEDWQGFLD